MDRGRRALTCIPSFGVGLVLFLLLLPLILKWHRLLLVAIWNTCAVLYFLPGRPEVSLAITWLSFVICVLQFIVHPRAKFISVSSITGSLLFFAVVIIFTAQMNGGIGFGSLGSSTMGGKKRSSS